MEKPIPILTGYNGKDEFITPETFAGHCPAEFVNRDKVIKKGIIRCYITFFEGKSDFLDSLPVIFKFHGGSCSTNVYEYKNNLIAISQLGAPAAANLMEELSVFGIKEFIAVGSAGCLNDRIKDKFMLVSKAIRDEGLSYHYLKPSTYVSTDRELNEKLIDYMKCKNFIFSKGITWTNDAYYRETDKKLKMAKELGASAVEMECAAWCAVAKHRKLKFSQILYFSDIVKQNSWTRLIKNNNGSYYNDVKLEILLMVQDMIDNIQK